MQCTKILTIAAFTVATTLALNAQAGENNNYQQKAKTVKTSDNPNKIIADTLFPNASPAEKARIQEQMAKYSQLQYGFGTAAANPSPKKDEDILNNIKSHNPATVKSQMQKMREAAKELPHLEKVQKNSPTN